MIWKFVVLVMVREERVGEKGKKARKERSTQTSEPLAIEAERQRDRHRNRETDTEMLSRVSLIFLSPYQVLLNAVYIPYCYAFGIKSPPWW